MMNIRFTSDTFKELLDRANKEGLSIPKLVTQIIEKALKAGL